MGVVESGGLLWLLQVNDLLLVAEAVRVRGLWESKGLEIRQKDERFLEREAVVVEAGDNLTDEEMAPLRRAAAAAAAAAAAEVELKAAAIIIN